MKAMEQKEGVQITIPHNLERWFVKTIERKSAKGNEYGFISGTDRKTFWNDDGSFTKELAEDIVHFHNNWLENQKPLELKTVEARRETEKWGILIEKQKAILKHASEMYLSSQAILGECEREQKKLDDLLINKELTDG